MIKRMARAKINLSLDVIGKLADGYHQVEMLMQSIELADVVSVRRLENVPVGTIQLTVDNEQRQDAVPADASNLAWRAADLFLQAHPQAGGVAIAIQKRIPMAAGLAGGSTDAAATLLGLYDAFHLSVDKNEAYRLGAKLGADVPFVMQGGTMLATGRGDVLQRVPDVPNFYVVLAKPPVQVSTPWAYAQFDREGTKEHPKTQKMLTAIRQGDRNGIRAALCNVLEHVTIKAHGEVAALKQAMAASSGMPAVMSGSGPTVFCLLDDEATAQRTAETLRTHFADATILVTRTAKAVEP